MTEYGVFNENGLVEISPNLSYREAATPPCAGLTAWNVSYGGKAFHPGVTVLTQGTGGVSMFAIQFALAGGAQVIATTSSGAKGEVPKKLGVRHVINYKEDKEWGQTAKKLSIGQRGADHIVGIGRPSTFAQSSVAAAIEGTVAVIGTRGGKSPSGSSSVHTNLFSTRRVMVGNRLQFEEMNRAIVANNIKPVMDEKSFRFDQVVGAYHYPDEGNHIGKVVVDVV
jgi:NADPH:quinone reductase-like Zn-dependent oxidoreductase